MTVLTAAGCKKSPDLKASGVVEGQVLDQHTGAPIPGAKLIVEGCKNGIIGGSGNCRPLATGVTNAEGRYRITWNGDGYSNTFYLRTTPTDSAVINDLTTGRMLEISKTNTVTAHGSKGRSMKVRLTVKKNDGRILRLRYGIYTISRGLMRPGPADTTFTVWAFPGNSAPFVIAALDQQQENYRGIQYLVRVAPWTEAVRDTAFTIDDIMALPKLDKFQP